MAAASGVRRELRASARLARERMAIATLGWRERLMDSTTWYQRVAAALTDLHRDAWRLGRAQATGERVTLATDRLVAQAIMDEETTWLQRFAADLDGGRYGIGDELKLRSVYNRLELYVGKARGVANEAFVEHGADDEEYEWRLGLVEPHCDDCPRLAALSPWSRDTMFTVPGRGETPCLTNCKCMVVRLRDGVASFDELRDTWPDENEVTHAALETLLVGV